MSSRPYGQRQFSVPARYALAVLAVALGVFARVGLLQSLGDRLSYLTLFPAVAATALVAGFGPGVFAALLSAFMVLVWWVDSGDIFFYIDSLDWVGMGVFILGSTIIAGFAQLSHRARRKLDERTQALAAVTAQLQEEARSRELSDRKLRESEERFRLAASGEGITLFEQDAALRYTWIHSQDPQHAQAVGRTDAEIIPGPEAEALMRRKAWVMRHGVPQRIEVRAPLPGGARYYDTVIMPRCDSEGRIIGVAGTALDLTQRKQREQGRQLLASIVEFSEDAIIALDLRGTITSWNRGAMRLFGYTAGEAVGRPVTMLIPPERQDEEPRILERIRNGERIDHFETRRRRKDGTELDISLAVSPLRDERGAIVGASKIARDVTERNRAERIRRFLVTLNDQLTARELPEEILETAARLTGEHLQAQRCCLAEWSEEAGRMTLGHEWRLSSLPAGVVAHGLCELGSVEWRQRLAAGMVIGDLEEAPDLAPYAEKCRALAVRSFASAGLVRKGERVVLLMVADDRPRDWRPDDLQLLDTIVQRVWPLVERARIEAALRASERQLRLVTDHAPVSLAQLDRHWRLKFVNRTYAQRLGSEPHKLIGRSVAEVEEAAAFARIRPHLEAAFAGRHVEFEFEIAPPAGAAARWVHAVFTPEQNGEGEVVGVIALITDVTARKEAERELARARDHALAASRAKDDFLAALSHELRTPLNPVLLIASEAAENSALPGEVRRDFGTIRKNVELEARLIDDLLDVTRITHGKLLLDLRTVNAEAILQDAVSVIRPDAEQKRITITADLAAVRNHVSGDAVRLQQVFWNVLKNAVKFTPTGGLIAITSENPEATSTLRVTVCDNGIGMTAGEMERVFDAFTQGDHAAGMSAHRFGGLGLGLTISRLLVEQHHGTIRVESAGAGRGSTFMIDLPLTDQPAGLLAVPKGQMDGSRSIHVVSRPQRAAVRVLLVEDHAPTREALASLLRRRNYEVVTAGSIAEARAALSDGGIGLLVSDIGLPDGDGCELMDELRGRDGVRGIALTGYGMDSDVARSLKAGFVAHLTKPIRVQALDAALATVDSSLADLLS